MNYEMSEENMEDCYKILLFFLDTDYNIYLFDKKFWLQYHQKPPPLQYLAAEKINDLVTVNNLPHKLKNFFKCPRLWQILILVNYPNTKKEEIDFLKLLLKGHQRIRLTEQLMKVANFHKKTYIDSILVNIRKLRNNEISKLRKRKRNDPDDKWHFFTCNKKFLLDNNGVRSCDYYFQ